MEDPYQVPFLEFLIVHRCAVWSGRVFNEQSKDKESHMLQCFYMSYTLSKCFWRRMDGD